MKIADQYIKYAKDAAQTDPQKGWERIKLDEKGEVIDFVMNDNVPPEQGAFWKQLLEHWRSVLMN